MDNLGCTYEWRENFLIDRNIATPLYLQAAEYLRNNIYSEEWTEGEKIPSENQIMDSLGISRGTVKKAVKVLVDEGLVEQIQGKGTFVKRGDINYPLGKGLLSFAEALEKQSLRYETKVLISEIREATKEIASKLRMEQGEKYLYLSRIREVENEKIMFIENRIKCSAIPGIEKVNFDNVSLFKVIEEMTGKRILFAESRYAARVVGTDRAKILDIPEDSPILHLEQLVYLERDNPIEFGNVWLKANRYYLGTTLTREEL